MIPLAKQLLLLFILSFSNVLLGTVRILVTAAVLPQQYEQRKQQYIATLKKFKEMGLSVYVVESCQKGPTFLDDYCDNVCYTQSNLPQFVPGLGNYGINEILAIKKGMQYFNFDPDDMVIKWTGKYVLTEPDFINLVYNNLDADLIARIWDNGLAYSALFAMKSKYLLDLANTIDIDRMAQGLGFEGVLYLYAQKLKKCGGKVFYWQRIYDYLPTPYGYRR